MRTFFVFSFLLAANLAQAGKLPPYKDPKVPTEARIDDLVSRLTLEEKLDLLGGTGFGSKANNRLKIPSIEMIDGPQGIRGPRATAFPGSLASVATWNPDLMRRVAAGIGREVKAVNKNMILGPCVTLYRVPQSGRNFECFGEDPWLNSRMAEAYVKGVQEAGVLSSTKHFLLNNQEVNRHGVDMHADERTIQELELPAFAAAVAAGTESIMSSYNLVDGKHASENPALLTGLIKGQLRFRGFIVSDWASTYDGKAAALAGLDLEMPYGDHLGPKLKRAVEQGEIPVSLVNDKIRRMMRALYKIDAFDAPKPGKFSDLNSSRNQALALEAARESVVLLKNQVLPFAPAKTSSIAVIGPNAATMRYHGGGSGQVSPLKNVTVLEGIKNRYPNAKVVYEKGVQTPGQYELLTGDLIRHKDKSGTLVNGFQVEYFTNSRLQGKPVIVGEEADIQIWNTVTPDPRLKFGKYSARWTGFFTMEKTGDLNLDFGVTGRAYRVKIDGKVISDVFDKKDGWVSQAQAANLSAGPHEIVIEYRNEPDNFQFMVSYEPPAPDFEKAVAAAKTADAVVLVVGNSPRFEAEDSDRPNINLPEEQERLVKAVLEVNPRTAVVVISGGPVLMRGWREKAPAILQAWFPGQEGGGAIADIISGLVNPSGKLPITIPRQLDDSPSAAYYHGQQDKIDYSKVGVMEGYRGYDSRGVAPEFPFGHGLSYSKFTYSDFRAEVLDAAPAHPKVRITLGLKNDGKVAGAEVAQLYVRELEPSVARPPLELKGFEKIKLEPGETKAVTFELDATAFRFWDAEKHGWKVNPGKFELLVGGSSRDLPLKGEVALKHSL